MTSVIIENLSMILLLISEIVMFVVVVVSCLYLFPCVIICIYYNVILYTYNNTYSMFEFYLKRFINSCEKNIQIPSSKKELIIYLYIKILTSIFFSSSLLPQNSKYITITSSRCFNLRWICEIFSVTIWVQTSNKVLSITIYYKNG